MQKPENMYNCDTVFGLFIGINVIVLGHFVTKKEKTVQKLLQPLADNNASNFSHSI
jgi:hypothetical protein